MRIMKWHEQSVRQKRLAIRFAVNLVGFILLISLLSYLSFSDNTFDQSKTEYCEMIELHRVTGGKAGWPDYKGAGNCP